MRVHVCRFAFANEVLRVVATVGRESDRPWSVGLGLDHGQRCDPLRMPETLVKQGSTRRPERFSIKACRRAASFASMPGPFRKSLASGSVVEGCVSPSASRLGSGRSHCARRKATEGPADGSRP
jgi:hypothetical protein